MQNVFMNVMGGSPSKEIDEEARPLPEELDIDIVPPLLPEESPLS